MKSYIRKMLHMYMEMNIRPGYLVCITFTIAITKCHKNDNALQRQ